MASVCFFFFFFPNTESLVKQPQKLAALLLEDNSYSFAGRLVPSIPSAGRVSPAAPRRPLVGDSPAKPRGDEGVQRQDLLAGG